jgi:hypothetical protein
MFHYENWIVDGALAGIDPETPPNALLITVIPPKIESPFLKHTNKSTSSSVLKSPIPEMTKVSPEDIEGKSNFTRHLAFETKDFD